MEDRIVLCGASAYEQKYFFNTEQFGKLPTQIQEELRVLCIMYVEEISGVFTMEFDADGTLQLKTEALDADAMYDEIGGALRIRKLQREKEELFASLELFYKVFILGEVVPVE